MPPALRPYLVATAALVVLALLPRATAAQKHDPKRAVVVFAGFGYFDPTQHQWLTGLVERKDGLVAEGRALEAGVREAAERTFATPLRRWSSHRLVFDSETLKAAFLAATGERDVQDTGPMLAAFDRVYVLVLTGGFEHHAVQKTPWSRGVFYHPYTFASVHATLLDNGSGSILLSTSVLAIQDGALQSADPGDAWAPRYRAVYTGAAARALARMRELIDTSDPSASDKAKDAYTVTGAVVATGTSEGAFAAREFEWQTPAGGAFTLSDSVGRACKPATYCSSEGCRAMTGLLVGAVSESLSNRGYRVLPPVSWDDSLLKADNILRYRLSLPAEAMSGMMRMTNVAFDPERATHKTVAVLTGLGVSSKPDANEIKAVDTYTASVNAQVFRTDPRTCATLSSAPLTRDESKGIETDDGRPLSSALPDQGTRQLMFLRAARRAAQNLAKR